MTKKELEPILYYFKYTNKEDKSQNDKFNEARQMLYMWNNSMD